MQRLAVLMARSLAFIETSELNQRGTLYFPAIAEEIKGRYGFIKYPREAKDFNLTDGIEFGDGKSMDGISIDRLAIWGGTLLVETQVSTDASRAILLEMLFWLRDEFGATFNENQVRRWACINQVLFKTDFPILAEFSRPLARLAERTNAVVSEMFGEKMGYRSQEINIGHDPTARKNGVAGLQILHRGGVPRKDNRYYSEAPLPTDIHWELLEEFEKNVLEDQHAGSKGKIRRTASADAPAEA
jgi:hypothetical protein